MRQAKKWLDEQRNYRLLWNLADARNQFHQKLLRLLGFKAITARPVGPYGLPYLEIVKLCASPQQQQPGVMAGGKQSLAISAIGTVALASCRLSSCRLPGRPSQRSISNGAQRQSSLANQQKIQQHQGQIRAEQASRAAYLNNVQNANSAANKSFVQEQFKMKEARMAAFR